jgi:hypothetical protein
VSTDYVKSWKKTVCGLYGGVDKLKKASRMSTWKADNGAAKLVCSMEDNEIK